MALFNFVFFAWANLYMMKILLVLNHLAESLIFRKTALKVAGDE